MATLAIKGHATRGSEVIELLEMLGGKNFYNKDMGRIDMVFYISDDKRIRALGYEYSKKTNATIFTLEEFLEKFPYKVGDKVNVCGENAAYVIGMRWESDYVVYRVKLEKNGYETSKMVEELQPLIEQKEESMEEPKDLLIGFTKDDNGDWVLNTHKDYEIKEFDGKFKLVKKQPQYPKTYDECCDILRTPNDERYIDIDVPLFYNDLLNSFTQLLICRDAYWKIAGNWKPDFTNDKQEKYGVYVTKNIVIKDFRSYDVNQIFTFPTEEMRDTFYENFKELIEECKELL